MKIIAGTKRARLADLYWLSGSFRTGELFEFAAHNADSSREKSPQKFRLPELGDPGYEHLPEMSVLAAEMFWDMAVELGIEADCFAGVPAGIEPIVDAFEQITLGGICRLRFIKEQRDGDNYFVGPVEGAICPGDRVLGLDDHTSGGHNKKRFMLAIERAGGRVPWFFTIVDRGQGATAFMHQLGVVYCWIFTLEELLEYYLEKGWIDLELVQQIRGYVARNQIGETA